MTLPTRQLFWIAKSMPTGTAARPNRSASAAHSVAGRPPRGQRCHCGPEWLLTRRRVECDQKSKTLNRAKRNEHTRALRGFCSSGRSSLLSAAASSSPTSRGVEPSPKQQRESQHRNTYIECSSLLCCLWFGE